MVVSKSCPQVGAPVHTETTTGTYHRFIPEVPQDFDCRVKARIRKAALDRDLEIKNEAYKTNYGEDYYEKANPVDKNIRALPAQEISYLRTVQEKMFKNPPAPIAAKSSEMKDSYLFKRPLQAEEILSPVVRSKCWVQKVGLEEQPTIPPERRGFWKWLDPYLTTNKADFTPFLDGEVSGPIKDEVLTNYNVSKFALPPVSGNTVMFDKVDFKMVLPGRLLSRGQNRVPNSGMQSEYQDRYIHQCFSDLYPYIGDCYCVYFDDSLSPSSRFQDLIAPGMFCSDYCHIGGKSVRCVVDTDYSQKEIKRTKNCSRLY